MGKLDDNRVRQALATAKIQSFSSELVAMQSCRDDTELYSLLIRAVESEPFLMSRVVRVANSVVFARYGTGHTMGASECLLRIGLSMGKQIAEDFLIDQALGRIARANRFSRSVWREARLAGSVAHLFESVCEDPFNHGGPNLPAIMSYLGELFGMSLVKAEYELPVLHIPAQPDVSQLDVVELSLLALSQLQMPQPVDDTIRALGSVGGNEASRYARSAAAVLLCRVLAKSAQSVPSFTAIVTDDSFREARDLLSISASEWVGLADEAKRNARMG